MSKRNRIYLIISLLIILVAKSCPSIGLISADGITAIGLLIAMIILVSSNAIPMGVTVLLCVVLEPILGLMPSLNETTASFASFLLFFITLMFAIGLAFQNTTLVKRMFSFMLKRVKNDGKGPIMVLWLTAFILSSVVGDVAVIIIMLVFAQEYLSIFEKDEKALKNIRPCLMYGLVIASLLGGNMTILGSPANMMVLNYAMQNGYNLSFLNWMVIAIPVSIVVFLIGCKILFWIFKPQKMDEKAYSGYLESNNIKGKLEGKEILLVCIIIAIILLSIIIPSFFNIQTELLICSLAVLVLLPAFKLTNYEQLEKSGAITQSLCVCMFISISAILSSTGVAGVIVNWMQSLLPTDPSITIVVLILCIISIIMGNIMPSTAVPPLLAVPMILLAQSYGFNPILLLIPLAMLSNCTWILPMDPVTMIPFGHRQFTLGNIVKPGISLGIISVIITVAWVAIVAGWGILAI